MSDKRRNFGIQLLRFSNPQHSMYVAQPARAAFDIRFQRSSRALGFTMAQLHFDQLRFNKGGNITLFVDTGKCFFCQFAIAAKKAGF